MPKLKLTQQTKEKYEREVRERTKNRIEALHEEPKQRLQNTQNILSDANNMQTPLWEYGNQTSNEQMKKTIQILQSLTLKLNVIVLLLLILVLYIAFVVKYN
jgi:hypothetical protein